MLSFVGHGEQALAWVCAPVTRWEEKWVELPGDRQPVTG